MAGKSEDDAGAAFLSAAIVKEMRRMRAAHTATLTGSKAVPYTLENTTDVLVNVHDPAQCAGRACTIHNRSTHHMRSWPQQFREDRGLMERQSPFGTGCPDPDTPPWQDTTHGCVVHPYSGKGGCSPFHIDGYDAALLYLYPGHAVTIDGKVWSWWNDDGLEWNADPTELTNGKTKTVRVKSHTREERVPVDRLILFGFKGPKLRGSGIWHLDGDLRNNTLENLSYEAFGEVM